MMITHKNASQRTPGKYSGRPVRAVCRHRAMPASTHLGCGASQQFVGDDTMDPECESVIGNECDAAEVRSET